MSYEEYPTREGWTCTRKPTPSGAGIWTRGGITLNEVKAQEEVGFGVSVYRWSRSLGDGGTYVSKPFLRFHECAENAEEVNELE